MVTDAAGASAVTTLTWALFAIMIPLTFGFLTFVEPLSHEITTFPETEIFAEPPSAGVVTLLLQRKHL